MPVIQEVETDSEKGNHFRNLAVKAGSDAIRYRIVERFLCEVERWLLKPSESVFDVSLVKENIKALKSLPSELTESLAQAEVELKEEFRRWDLSIEEKDRCIETYNFRRFCDSAAEPLDNEIYVALASFYKSRQYSHSNLSKFDLIVTRLYTDVDRTGRRFLKFNPQEITSHVEQSFGTSNAGETAERFLDNPGAVAAIQSFIAEAQGLDDFESLIQCKLFDRFREFKQELSDQFFEPAVVAAAIQCNVVFANAFNEMLEAANESLTDILTSDLDIASALHDPAPETRSHLSDLLHEFFDVAPDKENSGKASEHLRHLLSLAGEKGEQRADPLTESPNIEFDASRSARERLWPHLETLTMPEPDASMLLGQIGRTKTLQNLNLSDFLYAEDHAPDARSRRILGLILWTEEFRQNELGLCSTLTPSAQHEVVSLIQKSEEFAAILKADINAASESTKGRLLVVQNSLLESRLRLEGAIVKFTSRNLSPSRETTAKDPVRKPFDEHTPRTQVDRPRRKKKRSSARWILWVLVLAAAAAAVYFLYPNIESSVPTDPSVTERIDTRRLADHDLILNAYGRGNTMFVTAREAWLKLPAEKQKESLKNLLEYKGATKYENVVVRDAGGHLLGNISPTGLYVPGESAAPEANTKSN
jgi:hypothetical protein